MVCYCQVLRGPCVELRETRGLVVQWWDVGSNSCGERPPVEACGVHGIRWEVHIDPYEATESANLCRVNSRLRCRSISLHWRSSFPSLFVLRATDRNLTYSVVRNYQFNGTRGTTYPFLSNDCWTNKAGTPGATSKESGGIPEHEDKTYDDGKQGYDVVGKVDSWVFIVKIRNDQSEYCNRQNRAGYWPYNLKGSILLAIDILCVQANLHYPLKGEFNLAYGKGGKVIGTRTNSQDVRQPRISTQMLPLNLDLWRLRTSSFLQPRLYHAPWYVLEGSRQMT